MIQFDFTNFLTANAIASVIAAASQLNPIAQPPQNLTVPVYQQTSATQESTNTHKSTRSINICEGNSCQAASQKQNTPTTPRYNIVFSGPLTNRFHRPTSDLFGINRQPDPTPTSPPTPSPTPTLTPTLTPTPPPIPTQPDQPEQRRRTISFPTRTPFNTRFQPRTINSPRTSNPTPPPPTPTPTPEPTNNSELDAVNSYREEHGLNQLTATNDICQVAQQRAQEADRNFSHDGFESGVAKLDYSRAAENLWQGQPFTYQRMVQAWHDSSGHRANMQGDYTHGCGARSGNTAAFIFIKR